MSKTEFGVDTQKSEFRTATGDHHHDFRPGSRPDHTPAPADDISRSTQTPQKPPPPK